MFQHIVTAWRIDMGIVHRRWFEQRCSFIMMVPTTLFESVRPSSHEQCSNMHEQA